MKKEQVVYLEYLSEFGAYGVRKDVISELKAKGIVAKILLPEEVKKNDASDKPTLGFLLGQDKSENGVEYYSISKSYMQAIMNTGANVQFLDYDNAYVQMRNCDGAILPGGSFNNPEKFYIDGKKMGDYVGKRYFAYRTVIEEAYKKQKPLLGICGGAQMIGALLGNMKMYRNLKEEIPHPAVHNPKADTDVRVHRIELLKGTPIFKIMGVSEEENYVIINSRHNQSMVHDALQDYVKNSPRVKMKVYAISDSDGIPEIWGNDEAGILCVQGHPEDLVSDNKMQNLYNYIAVKAGEYKMHRKVKSLPKCNKESKVR